MSIERATSLLFLSSLELLSSTRKAPTLRCCIAPGVPYHRGATSGVREEAAKSTTPLLSWHETKLDQDSLLRISPMFLHSAHCTP